MRTMQSPGSMWNRTASGLSATNYTFSFSNGTLTVTKATPVINWSNPADITYGTALGGTQLNATVTNPNDWEDITADLTDSAGAGSTCAITGGGTGVVVLAGKTATLNYACTFTSGAAA